MFLTSIVVPILALVVVFLFSIQKFSKHIHRIADADFKRLIHKATSTPIKGIALGAIFTSLIQSSTATTVILVGLVNAELLSFTSSLGIIFGANIGSTITSYFIALNLTNLAPYIILLGFFVIYAGKKKYLDWGKAIFYFGLTFLALSLISLYIEPVRSNPDVINILSNIHNPLLAILGGFIFTAVVQSSAITSGLAIIMVGGGLLNFDQALGIILGANLGTTVTVLIASVKMNTEAQRVAFAHFLFNLLGILLILPFLHEFSSLIHSIGGTPIQQIANAHLIFNLVAVAIFLIFIKPFSQIVRNIIQ